MKLNKMLDRSFKTLKKLVCENFGLIAAVVVVLLVLNYQKVKSMAYELVGMENRKVNAKKAQADAGNNNYQANDGSDMGVLDGASDVNHVDANMESQMPSSCNRASVNNPKDLLPHDKNTEFSKLNPQGAGSLLDVSLLQSGHHIGINTTGTSLRNANLQLRSEPANPKLETGPWNQSTITGDTMRRPLELGGN